HRTDANQFGCPSLLGVLRCGCRRGRSTRGGVTDDGVRGSRRVAPSGRRVAALGLTGTARARAFFRASLGGFPPCPGHNANAPRVGQARSAAATAASTFPSTLPAPLIAT